MMFWDKTLLCSLVGFYTCNLPSAQVLKLLVFTSILTFCFSLKWKLSYQYLFFPNTREIIRKKFACLRNKYFRWLENVGIKILHMLCNWSFTLGIYVIFSGQYKTQLSDSSALHIDNWGFCLVERHTSLLFKL